MASIPTKFKDQRVDKQLGKMGFRRSEKPKIAYLCYRDKIVFIQQILTIEEIKSQYPEQWLLVGNPELRNPKTNASFLSRLTKGTMILANKDKRELAYQSKEFSGLFEETISIYTGEVAQNRVFLL